MDSTKKRGNFEQSPVLPEDVPVIMPLLPHSCQRNTNGRRWGIRCAYAF